MPLRTIVRIYFLASIEFGVALGIGLAYSWSMAEIIFNSLQHKKDLEKVGVPTTQAEKHVEIMGQIINTHLATKENIHVELLTLRHEMQREFASVRGEMATEFKAVRSEMASEFKAVRNEMTDEFKAMRSEMAAEFKAVRSEMTAEFKAMHKMMAKYFIIAISVLGALITILGFSLK